MKRVLALTEVVLVGAMCVMAAASCLWSAGQAIVLILD